MNNILKNKKRSDIQGLRGIAVLGVVCYHYGWLSGGYVGVDIFFVVSGFVITSLIIREIITNNSFKILKFFSRRVRRLLPALSLVTFLVLIASLLLESPSGAQQSTLKIALAGMIFGSNFIIPLVEGNYFDAVMGDNPLLHIWSLSVEEQFYFIVPIVIFIVVLTANLLKLKKTIHFFLKIFLVLFFISILVTYLIYFLNLPSLIFPNKDSLIFYSPITRAWEFLVGSIVACTPDFLAKKSTITKVFGALGYVLILIPMAMDISLERNIIIYAPVVCLGTALVIKTADSTPKKSNRIVESKLLNWVGDRSYSIYLFHWPILVFGNIFSDSFSTRIVLLALTILVAHFSFILWENRFRAKNTETQSRSKKQTSLVLSMLIPCLLMSLIFYHGNQSGWSTDWALGSHSGIQLDCDVPPFKPEICTWGNSEASDRILVVGDSQSWAVADGVIEAGARVDKRVILASHNNCPFVFAIDFGPSNYCQGWQQSIIEWIDLNKPEWVIVANAEYGGELNGKIALQVVESIRKKGAQVIWILNPSPAPENLVRRSLVFPVTVKARTFSRPELDSTNLSVQNSLKSISGVYVINPSNSLCSKSKCFVSKDGAEYYTDQNHLSVSGAKLLSREFISILS